MLKYKRLTTISACLLFISAGLSAAELSNLLSTDVVVVGAGGTGVSAAAAAYQNGAKVIILEKMPFIGGSSALAGGAIAAGDSNAQKRANMTDTTAEGFANIWINDQQRSYPGGDKTLPDVAKIKNISKEFTVTANWLEDTIGHKFATPRPFGYGGPNYAHAPAESPIPKSGRGSSPAGGRFVIKAFQNYLTEKNIPIYTSSPVDELIVDNKGSVVGVRGRSKNGEKFEVKAKAVVLATGGFPHNEEMLKRLVPAYAKYAKVSVASVGNTGDGINMAKRIGASEYKDAWVIGLQAGAQKKELNATFSTKNKYKDSVFVNDEGKRFVKEDLPYLTDAIAHQKAAWAITDSTDPKKVEVLKQYNDPNIAVHGSTWQELAKAMGVSTENLVTTMTAYNEACRTGDDKLFNKPKEHLLPFLNPPYFAVRVVPQTGGTIGGIKTNDKFQVLRDDNTVIKGLYAGGEVTNRPYYNRVYTSGSGLGIAYTSGRIAGTNAAKEK